MDLYANEFSLKQKKIPFFTKSGNFFLFWNAQSILTFYKICWLCYWQKTHQRKIYGRKMNTVDADEVGAKLKRPDDMHAFVCVRQRFAHIWSAMQFPIKIQKANITILYISWPRRCSFQSKSCFPFGDAVFCPSDRADGVSQLLFRMFEIEIFFCFR